MKSFEFKRSSGYTGGHVQAIIDKWSSSPPVVASLPTGIKINPNYRYNHQNPPVSDQDIHDGGCQLDGDDVYDWRGNLAGKFEEVEWGYGATGGLIINHKPITQYPVQIRKDN